MDIYAKRNSSNYDEQIHNVFKSCDDGIQELRILNRKTRNKVLNEYNKAINKKDEDVPESEFTKELYNVLHSDD